MTPRTNVIQCSLQSFSVPGTIFLSFLGGALFGLIPGILIVAFVRFSMFSLLSTYGSHALEQKLTHISVLRTSCPLVALQVPSS